METLGRPAVIHRLEALLHGSRSVSLPVWRSWRSRCRPGCRCRAAPASGPSGTRFRPLRAMRTWCLIMSVVMCRGNRIGVRLPIDFVPGPRRGPSRSPRAELALAGVGAQREDREVIAIEVIPQVEHLREPGAGEPRLVPGAVGVLGARPGTRRRPATLGLSRLAGRDQARAAPTPSATRCSAPAPAVAGRRSCGSSRPSRRRRSARPSATAPPAGTHGLRHVDADCRRGRQHLPGAVEVVHAPAAEPAPSASCSRQDERDRPVDRAGAPTR